MNLSNEHYKLYKNTIVAMYEPVEIGKHEQVNSIRTDPVRKGETYSHVEELLHESSSNLNQSHVERLKSLLYDYKSNRKAMNRNWSNQKTNPALKTKMGNK